MKLQPLSTRPRRGYTLLELVGSLCVLTTLVTLVTPRVIHVLDDAKLTATVVDIGNVQAAALGYFEQYGKFAGLNGATITSWTDNAYEYWDQKVLFKERFLERVMQSGIATAAYVRLAKVSTTNSSTLILSSGGLGHLPSHNGNNALYNLTQEYAALDLDSPIRLALRPARGDFWGRVEAFQDGLAATARRAGLRPLLACYSLPTGWKLPPPTLGGFGGGGPVTFANPNAKTQITGGGTPSPTIVAELVLEGVSVANAYRLSRAIDGRRQSNWSYWDSLGRVKYDFYGNDGGTPTGEVFIYLAHQ